MICRRQFIAECLGAAILRAGRPRSQVVYQELGYLRSLITTSTVGGSLLPMDFREQARSHIGQVLSVCRCWLAFDGL